MKKQLLFLYIAVVAIEMQSQNAIPNPDFELWAQDSYENPMSLVFNSNENCYRHNLPPNISKVTPAYHGMYAIELKSITNQLAYALNTDPSEGDMNRWKNGIAYTDRPTGIRGYYKYNVETADSAMLVVIFRKNSTVIGNYQYKLGGLKPNFTLFDYSFTPALTENPDSLIFCLVASDFSKNENGLNGSTFIVDSVSLKGVSTQPALLDGDFETWQNYLLPLELNDWNPQNKNQEGLSRSTDAKTGQYALQLTTFLGEQNNQPSAQPGYLTSGYWDDICGCSQGGMPYTLTKDTLVFWYKYTPQGNDQAQVYLEFRQNGLQIGGALQNLNAATSYQYVEIPFQLGVVPDHVIIQAISSQWQNRSLSYVGSTFLLDNMYFKSSITGVAENVFKDKITLSPNPVRGVLNINTSDISIKSIDLYDITGKKVFTTFSGVSNIDVSTLTNGVYFVRIDTGKHFLNYKIVKS